MRITYITHTRFPTEKAHGQQVAHVCHALSQLGHTVTLLHPKVRNAIRQKAHTYYGFPESFTVEQVDSFDALGSKLVPGAASIHVAMMSYAKALKKYIKHHNPDLLYLRSTKLLPLAIKTGLPTIIELHSLPRFRKKKLVSLCNKCTKVVCLTSQIKKELIRRGVQQSQIIVEGDAVDPSRFEHVPTHKQVRKKWKLETERPVLGYVGSLVAMNTMEKGVAEFIHAVKKLKDKDVFVFAWIVGGPERWQEKYQRLAESLGLTSRDIEFEGRIPHAEVASAIMACDICIYPAPESDHPFFMRDTSPLKLFEYFAAGRPVVCANIPPLKDVVTHADVQFYKPGMPGAFADAIEHLLDHPKEAAKLATRARSISKKHTWKKRMKRILETL